MGKISGCILATLVATVLSVPVKNSPEVVSVPYSSCIYGEHDPNCRYVPIVPPSHRPTHPMDDPNWIPPTGHPHELYKEYWLQTGQELLQKQLNKNHLNKNIAKNVIIVIGDGMSIPTQAATRVYMGDENVELSFEKFPYAGLSKTYCVNYQVSDSACTGTAFLAGIKNNYGTLGVSAAVPLRNCSAQHDERHHIDSIFKWAQNAGKATGIVTNTRITHATPATAYARSADREWESTAPEGCDDVAKQLIHGDVGSKIKVILGGGWREFVPKSVADSEGNSGFRTDNRNLIEEWLNLRRQNNANGVYVTTRDELLNVDVEETDYLFGLFEHSHMSYALLANKSKEPSLEEMSQRAVEMLRKYPNGYVLLVEGGRIDHAHHQTWARLSLPETVEFHKTVEKLEALTNEEDTLIVVTADHSHTMTIGGYPPRGTDILSKGDFSREDAKPFFTLNYANGLGFFDHFYKTGGRRNPLGMPYRDALFRHPATVPLDYETHGGDDVGVFAIGPWAHLFTGTYEQHLIAHAMMYASCLGDGLKADQCNDASGLSISLAILLTSLSAALIRCLKL
ncbi:alkaline phosphatase-like [Phlebotomus papatasi]|uniref:alkaline phosphatase-like n=1 Tax=Phlebotomus papatasi TaxID=29031 RepID=UPI00248436FB|nr:alkaline phosphatase-like [Phlebotomus papatasi]